MHSLVFKLFLIILLKCSYLSCRHTKSRRKEVTDFKNGTYEKRLLENKNVPSDSTLFKINSSTKIRRFSTSKVSTKDGFVNSTKDVTDRGFVNISLYHVNVSATGIKANRTRKRRYNYEDKADWSYDDEEIDYEDEKKEKNSFWKNAALNWQTMALRVIQLICFLIVLMCICFVCARQLFRNVCGGCIYCCETCYDKITGRDRVYRKVKEFCDQFGIKMDYDTYEEITKDLKEILQDQGVELKLD